jgi:hypothetical protein
MRCLAFGIALACGAGACKSHWTAETLQPVLPLYADKSARTSWPLTIIMRDMEMRHRRLANTAYYVVVSRDRLRFHLTLQHKWESMSDIRTWDAWVEDASGVHHPLEEVSQRSVQVGFDPLPVTRRAAQDGLGPAPVYCGFAEFTIYGRDLYASARRLTLVLRRPGYEYRYVWRIEDEPEPEPDAEAGVDISVAGRQM